MKVQVVLVALASALLFATVPARAVTELCPARLTAQAVSSTAQNSRGPATLFGFELSAYGPRTVSATLEFCAPLKRLFFIASLLGGLYARKLTAPAGHLFPAHVTPPTANVATYKLDPNDDDHLDAAPSAMSTTISAVRSPPLYHPVCANPFRFGGVASAVSPDPGDDARMHGLSGITYVEVAINPDGTLADSWVWLSSGEAALDNAVLRAAQSSQYENAIAYCEAVPSRYLFKVTFG